MDLARIGFGSDLHRLEKGTGLRLGGVTIPCDLKTLAWSDGDVLLHAIVDAILGALGEGDIGELFPDTAKENAGRDSVEFLSEAMERAYRAGYRVGNLDATVHLERPKLSPFKDVIRRRLRELLATDAIAVKAKTAEGLGPIGEGKAIAAEAVILLVRWKREEG